MREAVPTVRRVDEPETGRDPGLPRLARPPTLRTTLDGAKREKRGESWDGGWKAKETGRARALGRVRSRCRGGLEETRGLPNGTAVEGKGKGSGSTHAPYA